MATTKKTASKAKSSSKQAKSRTAGQPRRQKKSETKTKSPSETEVTIDRRRNSRRKENEETAEPTPTIERREKVQRRRQIDPTTCERDYTDQEIEFMNAMDQYKRTSGRMFPTCSEVLEVIRDLGYVQLNSAQRTALGLTSDDEQPAGEGDEQAAEQEALEAAGM